MKLARWMAVLALAGVLSVAGCKKDGDGTGGGVTVKQDSPKAVLETVHQAFAAMDMNAVVQCMDPAFQPAMRDILGPFNQFRAKVEELAAAVERKIGPDEAKQLRAPLEQMKQAGPLEAAVKDGKLDWSLVKIEESGDTASVMVAGRRQDMQLVKVKGRWYVKPDEGRNRTPEDLANEAKKVKAQMEKGIQSLDDFKRKVESGAVTKDNFEDELDKVNMPF